MDLNVGQVLKTRDQGFERISLLVRTERQRNGVHLGRVQCIAGFLNKIKKKSKAKTTPIKTGVQACIMDQKRFNQIWTTI